MFTKKIHLFLTIWLLLIIPVINISLYLLFYKITTDDKLDHIRLQAETIAEALKPVMNHTDVSDSSVSDILKARLPLNGMMRIVDKDSNVIMTVTKETELLNAKAMFNSSQTNEVKSINEVQYAVAHLPMTWKDGNVVTLEVIESLASIQENMRILKLVLIAASLVVFISLLPFIFNRKNTK